jgi:hypothetical protein
MIPDSACQTSAEMLTYTTEELLDASQIEHKLVEKALSTTFEKIICLTRRPFPSLFLEDS